MEKEQDIQARLDRFYNDTGNTALIKEYLSETFFDIIGKAHSETVHSNFLEWFFKQHTWDSSSIKRMIGLAMIKSDMSKIEYKKLISDFEKLKSCTVSGIEIGRAHV